MSDSTTCSSLHTLYIPCSMDDGERKYNAYISLIMGCNIIIIILAPVAVVGNALILAAIWKKTFERTSFHILLSGLAFSDLCIGLVAQPLIGVICLLVILNPSLFVTRKALFKTIWSIGFLSGIYFSTATLLIITLMSVERWLLMTQRSLMTSHRRRLVLTVLLLIPIPIVYFSAVKSTKAKKGQEVDIGSAAFILVCYLITSVAYYKVFRIIRQHQQQVQENQSSQNFGQPAINLAKYKRSVVSILYILAIFSLSFLPMIVSLTVLFSKEVNAEIAAAYHLSFLLLCLSSSINPCLYLWRMNDVRNGVKQLFCTNG